MIPRMNIEMARAQRMADDTALSPHPPVFSREVRLLGAAFAVALFVVASIVWGIAGVDPVQSAFGKIIGIAGDAVLAVLITLVLWRIRARPLGVKAIVACLLSLGASPVSALVDWIVSSCYASMALPVDPNYIAQVVIFTTSELFGWSCLYLALQYSAEVREKERRLAALREEALSAQMRALHYQVNPHFLFNTLNSVAGLIEEGASQPAREMVLRLAGFLRSTIALDPLSEIPLREEVDLQLAYLGIEAVRFADRMSVDIRIDPAVRGARVPALLLQPLVENAVKHGVARTPGPARVAIAARPEPDGRICLSVENSMPPSGERGNEGLGIGLANVANRLAARFGGDADCRRMVTDAGDNRVEIRMPHLP